jgi:cytochrome c biogenesis protein CcdA
MLRLIGLVLSISFADSMNPSTIAPGLYLASGEQPRGALTQFTLGVLAVNLAGGALLVFGPGEVLLSLVPHPSHTVRYIVELVAGVVMLGAAGLIWARRTKLSRHELPTPSDQGRSSIVLGATIAAVELPTAFPYFAAIAAIIGSGFDPFRQLFLLVLYNLCFTLPLLLMIGTVIVAGDQAERVLASVRDFLERHWPVLLAALALLAGAFVATLGATGLAQGGHGTLARFSRGLRRSLVH